MTTISVSLDEETKKGITEIARKAKKSRSDIVRDMYRRYRIDEELDYFQKITTPILEQLDIETEQQLFDYLESDDTYEDRIRQQRLPRRHKAK